jgi:hypothetical protein
MVRLNPRRTKHPNRKCGRLAGSVPGKHPRGNFSNHTFPSLTLLNSWTNFLHSKKHNENKETNIIPTEKGNIENKGKYDNNTRKKLKKKIYIHHTLR